MTKGEQTKQRMLGATAKLIRRQGYHATGLNEIVKASRAPKGSLYFHFPGGKDELAAAALAQAGTAWRETLLAAIARSPDDFGRAVMLACDAIAVELESSQFTNGCPLATMTLEVASENEPLRQLAEKHYKSWEALIADRLVAGGIPPAHAESLATVVLSSIEGALLLSRAYANTEPLRRVGQHLAQLASRR